LQAVKEDWMALQKSEQKSQKTVQLRKQSRWSEQWEPLQSPTKVAPAEEGGGVLSKNTQQSTNCFRWLKVVGWDGLLQKPSSRVCCTMPHHFGGDDSSLTSP